MNRRFEIYPECRRGVKIVSRGSARIFDPQVSLTRGTAMPMEHPAISIRTARSPGDAALLARLGAATFEQAFASANTNEDMACYLKSSFSPSIQAAQLQSPDALFLIAAIDGTPGGYARLDRTEAPLCIQAARPVELVRFYLDRAWHGRGVSHKLMEEVLRHATEREYDVIWLGVWEHNGRAVNFYRKWGFGVAGAKAFQLGSDLQTDLVMSCVLPYQITGV